MQETGLFIEMVLWIISQVIVAIITILLFYKYFKSKKEGLDARFELGLAVFFAINLIIYIYNIFCSFFVTCDPIFAEIVLIVTLISLIEMVFTIEHVILTKDRYIITILYLINFATILIIGISTGKGFLVPPMSDLNLALIYFLPLVYFYLAYKTEGVVRKRSTLFGIGFLLTLSGGTFRYQVIEQLFPTLVQSNPDFYHAFPVVVMLAGLCMILYTSLKYFK